MGGKVRNDWRLISARTEQCEGIGITRDLMCSKKLGIRQKLKCTTWLKRLAEPDPISWCVICSAGHGRDAVALCCSRLVRQIHQRLLPGGSLKNRPLKLGEKSGAERSGGEGAGTLSSGGRERRAQDRRPILFGRSLERV